MKLLVDMNLSPDWVPILQSAGITARHWSEIGDPRATDREIMSWARNHEFVVFTHDLDFGDILATTNAKGPSVVLLRAQDVNPYHHQQVIFEVFRRFGAQLEKGALVSIDKQKSRVRILPLFDRE